MAHPQDSEHISDPHYCGRVLKEDYAPRVKNRVEQCILAFKALEDTGSPAIPYLAAWKESDGKIWYEFASRRFCQLMGCTPQELAGVFSGSIVDRRVYGCDFSTQTISRLELIGARNRIREEGKRTGISESVFKVAPPDRDIIWLKDQAVVEYYSEDGLCLSVGTLVEVSKEMEAEEKRRQAELALAESEKKYRQTFENAASLIVLTSAEGVILDCNGRMAPYLGFTRQEVLGRPLESFILRESRTALAAAVRTAQLQGLASGVNLMFGKKDGGVLDANVNFSPLLDEQGNPGRLVCLVEDVTLKRQMEEELVRARKLEATGILAGGIAHDFNNLLTIIIGNMELAQMGGGVDGSAMQSLLAAKEAAIKAFRLTSKFITFSQGGSPVKKKLLVKDLLEDAIIEAMQDSMNFVLMGSSLEYRSEFDPDLWPTLLDEGQMRQVFSNILNNAKESMPGGGLIRVLASNQEVGGMENVGGLSLKSGRYVKVSIIDHGAGIRPQDMGKIFDPYFSTKDRGAQKGMGLGLSIAYSVVRKHNGYIGVQSNQTGGTTVSIYLPAAAPA